MGIYTLRSMMIFNHYGRLCVYKEFNELKSSHDSTNFQTVLYVSHVLTMSDKQGFLSELEDAMKEHLLDII